jgi:hypothetical protein
MRPIGPRLSTRIVSYDMRLLLSGPGESQPLAF